MKPYTKKLPMALTAIVLAGQLSFPAAALSVLRPIDYKGDIFIAETFQDRKLQAWLLNSGNLNGAGADGILTEQECRAVEELDLSGLGLTSLAGLEVFPNLTVLNCARNNLTQLDISRNPRLSRLYCSYNQLSSLDLSGNMELEHLNCNFNRIHSLNLSGHDKLISLYCEMNQMERLTLDGCVALKVVYCRNNQLTELKLTDNVALEFIETFDNLLTTIDVSDLQNLRFLHIDHNRLTELDMSHNKKLEGGGFVARNNFMETIHLPEQPGLTVYLDDYEEQDPVEGHDRVAWFLDPDFQTPAPAELEAAGQTLYSRRIPNNYKVYFSANGGNGSVSSLSTQWDREVQLPSSTALTRYGYTFSRWNTLPRGDGTNYEDEAVVRNLAGATTDGDRVTLYAMWTPNQYTIQLNPNGGDGAVKIQTALYGDTVTLLENTFTMEGKEFAGWAISPGGNVRYADQAQLQNLTAEANGTVDLYAVWRTPLSEIQKPYLEQLEAAFLQYSEAFYTEEDWATLSGAYSEAVNQIQSADSGSAMGQVVRQAVAFLQTVPTAEHRVKEITDSWTAAHKAVLDSMMPGALTEATAGKVAALAMEALSDLDQERLESRSTLRSEVDRKQVVGQAAEQLQATAEGLMTMGEAAKWLESLNGLTLRPMAQVQEEHLNDYQSAYFSYESMSERLKYFIDESVSDDLTRRYALSERKRTEAQILQNEYNDLDQSEYSAQGQTALADALQSGLLAIRSADSVDAVRQAGIEAWKQISQVPTANEEPAPPPTGGGGGNGGSGGGNSSGGAGSGGGNPGGGGSSSGNSGGTETGDSAGGSSSEKPEETITVTDEKTGAIAQVTTTPDGKVTAQVTIPDGVPHATVLIPCAEVTSSTVAVRILPDGSRRVLPRVVYRDDALAVRLEDSTVIELIDNSKNFSDVASGDWFADPVQFTASRELFSGVGNGTFAPYETMTRSMLVTVLHRLEGCPVPTASGSFQDVQQDSWYSTAADWAAEQGITSGTASGLFAPDAPITRETLALMLYRCAGSPEVAGGEILNRFQDETQISSWARQAMEWACTSGILTGDTNGQLRPKTDSTRAEVAAMLSRFVDLTTL